MPKYDLIKDLISDDDIKKGYFRAVLSMATLNLNGAILIKKYGVKAATDVTGFGLLGHSKYLAEA